MYKMHVVLCNSHRHWQWGDETVSLELVEFERASLVERGDVNGMEDPGRGAATTGGGSTRQGSLLTPPPPHIY